MSTLKRTLALALLLVAPSIAFADGYSMGGGNNVTAGNITSGTTTITGGADQSVCFDDGGVINCSDAILKYTKGTGSLSATTFVGALTGNASTATALAADGTDCSAGSYARGVDASGNAQGCTVAGTGTVTGSGTATDLVVWSSGSAVGNYTGTGTSAGNVIASLDATGAATFVPAGSTNITNVTGSIFVIPNKSTTGTTANKIAKLDTTASPATAIIATTTDTVNVLGDVVSGAGTTGSATILAVGQAPCQFDNTATVGDYVIVSTSVNGDCSDAGSATVLPTSVAVLGIVAESGTTASPRKVDFGTPEVQGTGGTGGKGISVQVGGTTTKSIANLNNTTPAASGNSTLATWQSSNSGNTTSVSAQVDPSTFKNLGYSGKLNTTSICAISANRTADTVTGPCPNADRYIAGTAGGGGITYTLPAATGSGRIIDISKVDSGAGSVTVAGAGGDLLNGSATQVLGNQYEGITVIDRASAVWDVPTETSGPATNALTVVGGQTAFGILGLGTEVVSFWKPTRTVVLNRISGVVVSPGTCTACGVTDHTFRVTDGSTNSDCTNGSAITCTVAAGTTFTCNPTANTYAAGSSLKIDAIATGGVCTTEPAITVNAEFAPQ